MRALSFQSVAMTRQRYPLVGDHGSSAPDYTLAPASTLDFVGSPQPTQGSTDRANRDGSELRLDVWVPDPAVDVQDRDLVLYRGDRFLVDGSPERWYAGVLDHAVLHLTRWRG